LCGISGQAIWISVTPHGIPNYGWQKDTFIFGSELKSLKAYPSFENEINRDALSLFLRHNNVPAPYSIYKGIHKLPAGHYPVMLEMSYLRVTVIISVAKV
jgi:asparagine synthetase B (glutamine-hydrolysing)